MLPVLSVSGLSVYRRMWSDDYHSESRSSSIGFYGLVVVLLTALQSQSNNAYMAERISLDSRQLHKFPQAILFGHHCVNITGRE